MPDSAEYFLKIIPREAHDAEVQILEENQLPKGEWSAGALANDGCIYYFPYFNDGGRILKLDPNNGDSQSLVGREIGEVFTAAVNGNDGCIYGISGIAIMKFNPKDYSLSQIGSDFDEYHSFFGAISADDDNIYSINKNGQILKVDTTTNDWSFTGNKIYENGYVHGWGRPVLGADKCIYFPPLCHDRVLKYNSSKQRISFFGNSYGSIRYKWQGAVLASDGYIYCIPYDAGDILQIDSRHINEQVIEMIEEMNTIYIFQN